MVETRRSKPSGCLKLLVYIIGMGVVAFLTELFVFKRPAVISPVPDTFAPKNQYIQFFRKEKKSDDLRNAVKATVGNDWANYSVYVVDYNSKLTMGINESLIYTAASVNKVPILAAIYDGGRAGTVNFDKVVTVQKADIQDYGTGSIRYDPPGTSYSVKTLVQLMMQKSDNTAAYILANYIVGFDKAQTYIDGLGLSQTDLIKNDTSNKDMALLFEKIYHKTITSPALADEMLGLLTNSDFEDRLPGQLPEDAKVYHKIGTATGAVHDAGIVTNGKMTYYIGIFTRDVPDEEQAAVLISKVSKVVYDFMRK